MEIVSLGRIGLRERARSKTEDDGNTFSRNFTAKGKEKNWEVCWLYKAVWVSIGFGSRTHQIMVAFYKMAEYSQFSSVWSLSRVWLFATPWTEAHSLSIANSWSWLRLTSIESVMPSNHLILCRPLLLLPSVFSSIMVFSNESVLRMRWPKYWSFSFNISPSNEYSVQSVLL